MTVAFSIGMIPMCSFAGEKNADLIPEPVYFSVNIGQNLKTDRETAELTLTFDPNGGKGDENLEPFAGNPGDEFYLEACPFTRTGYTFVCWNTKADGTGVSYKTGDTFILNETTTLYAQWKKKSNIKLKVNAKASVKKTKNFKIKATVKKNGKKLKKAVVYVRFKGKTYKKKTNSNGVAKITVKKSTYRKIKPGTTITYIVKCKGALVTKKVKIRK